MILNSVQTLCSFPLEKVGIFLDNTVTPEASARLGLRFQNNYYDNGRLQLNWNPNLVFNQVGIEPDLLNSQSLSSLYDPAETQQFVQPTNFISVPTDFPLFYTCSAAPFNNVLLNFKGGTSAITLFPSQAYPIITKTGYNTFTVSGTYLALSALDGNITKEFYYDNVDLSLLQPISNYNCSIVYNNSYLSSHKKNFLWKKVTTNALFNTIFNNDIIPAIPPFDNHIIPESFQIAFSLSGTGFNFAYNYALNYALTTTNAGANVLSGLPIEIIPYQPVQTFTTTANLDAINSRLTVQLKPSYMVPRFSNVTVSYETSSVTNQVIAPGIANFYSISSTRAAYLYNHQFNLNSSLIPSRKAFTINFSPSSIFIPTGVTSAFDLSTVMVDNFYQTYFPILENNKIARIQFIESTGDPTLSAIDKGTNIVYKGTQWIPASATLRFINSGIANFHTVNLQLSTCVNAIYNLDPLSFILNKDKASLTLNLTEVTDSSARATANVFPNYDPNLNVTWTIYPPENIIVQEKLTNRIIPLQTSNAAGLLDVNIFNLGVDSTNISIYSSEFDISANTIWNPSSAVYNNVALSISGILDDFPKFKNFSVSAVFIKQNLSYPVPQNGSIIWNEINHDARGFFEFADINQNIIYDNAIYPSIRNYSNINPIVSTKLVDANPATIIFNVNCNTIGDFYNLTTNKLFFAREYPDNANIFAILSCSDGRVIDTSKLHGTFFTSAVNITAIANVSQFSNISSSNIHWNLPTSNFTGLSTIFHLASTYCIGLSALSAKPLNGGFGYYNFSNNICLDVLDQAPPIFDYISFPEYKFFPAEHLSIVDNSYLHSNGLTGLSALGNQNFIISAFPGFDVYYSLIGNKLTKSSSNIQTINISLSDITTSHNVYVSGFNSLFVFDDPLTVYNTASSNNSNIFRTPIEFKDFPPLSANLSIDNNLFNIRKPIEKSFISTLTFVPTGINIANVSFNYILSSNIGIKISERIDTTNPIYILNSNFTLDPNDFFSIQENTYNIINFYTSGNTIEYVDPFVSFTTNKTFTSNIISLSVFDGPDLEIFTSPNIYNTNTVVNFINETDSSFPIKYDYFIFNDGNNHIQIVSSYNSPLSGIYGTIGLYSPSMTGIQLSGISNFNIWNNYIIIKDIYDQYEDKISRNFPETLELPYSQNDVLISPNSWQYSTTINDSFNKILTNYEYLDNMTSAFDITVPKYFIGWIGEKNGKMEWRYDQTYIDTQLYSNEIQEIKDIVFVKGDIFMINGNKIEIRKNDFNLTSIYSSNKITQSEIFQNPTRIAYSQSSNKLLILDKAQYAVFAFDISNHSLSLTHYWGGQGEKSSRTKLNNPTDMCTDNEGIIYIVDADSLVIKLYNQYLNWISMIEFSEWTTDNMPLSISSFNNVKYILSTKGIVYIFDENNNYVSQFLATVGNRIYTNFDNEGILYIIDDLSIYAYTFNGIFLNIFQQPKNITPVALAFSNKEIYLSNKYSIFKLIDFINIQKVKNPHYSLSAWNWSSIYIDPNEPVTSFVFNDSFKKIEDNLLLFSKDINEKFVIKIDEYDQFLFHTTSAISASEITLSAISFQKIGINELVTYETINRSINNIYYDLTLLKNMLEVRKERIQNSNICWTWKGLKIDKPQNINNNRRPYSWYELTSQIAVITGITWKFAQSCAGETNPFKLCWTWKNLGCNCLLPVTWVLMQCNHKYHKTWQQLMDNCCESPQIYFDDCIEIC